MCSFSCCNVAGYAIIRLHCNVTTARSWRSSKSLRAVTSDMYHKTIHFVNRTECLLGILRGNGSAGNWRFDPIACRCCAYAQTRDFPNRICARNARPQIRMLVHLHSQLSLSDFCQAPMVHIFFVFVFAVVDTHTLHLSSTLLSEMRRERKKKHKQQPEYNFVFRFVGDWDCETWHQLRATLLHTAESTYIKRTLANCLRDTETRQHVSQGLYILYTYYESAVEYGYLIFTRTSRDTYTFPTYTKEIPARTHTNGKKNVRGEPRARECHCQA